MVIHPLVKNLIVTLHYLNLNKYEYTIAHPQKSSLIQYALGFESLYRFIRAPAHNNNSQVELGRPSAQVNINRDYGGHPTETVILDKGRSAPSEGPCGRPRSITLSNRADRVFCPSFSLLLSFLREQRENRVDWEHEREERNDYAFTRLALLLPASVFGGVNIWRWKRSGNVRVSF